MEVVRTHVFIEGYVQGVNYRWWTQREASKLGLTGWVKNLADGRVEAIFEGPKEKVEEMVNMCKKGAPASDVKHVDVIWEKSTGEFTIFDVHPTV